MSVSEGPPALTPDVAERSLREWAETHRGEYPASFALQVLAELAREREAREAEAAEAESLRGVENALFIAQGQVRDLQEEANDAAVELGVVSRLLPRGSQVQKMADDVAVSLLKSAGEPLVGLPEEGSERV